MDPLKPGVVIMPRIMIVENEAAVALEIEERLKKLGYQIAGIGHSGEAAVAMARAYRPDLILMAIMLPGEIDGIVAAGKIREEMDIPVIFLTGDSQNGLLDRAKQVEPYGYILKPLQSNQIKAAIEIGLYNRKMDNRAREAREKLEKRVKDKRDSLNRITGQFKALLNSTTDTAFLMDLEGIVMASNKIAAKRFGMKLSGFLGKCVYDLMSPDLARARRVKVENVIKRGRPYRFRDERKGIILDSDIYPVFNDENEVVQLAVYAKDITKQVRAYEALKLREAELESKTQTLEDANIAMRVLLDRREEDRAEMAEKILYNVKRQVLPCIEDLRKGPLDSKQREIVDILESNLNDVLSPFTQRLTSRFFDFTPKEVRVANLLRQDKSTKEVALLMDVSTKAIGFHRENIRKKLGIKNKKVNLRSYLMTLA